MEMIKEKGRIDNTDEAMTLRGNNGWDLVFKGKNCLLLGQGGLVCCISWGRKESDTTEQLN